MSALYMHIGCLSYAPVTLESDHCTIFKSASIVLIFKSELNILILKIDIFAVTPVQLIGADDIHGIARKIESL